MSHCYSRQVNVHISHVSHVYISTELVRDGVPMAAVDSVSAGNGVGRQLRPLGLLRQPHALQRESTNTNLPGCLNCALHCFATVYYCSVFCI